MEQCYLGVDETKNKRCCFNSHEKNILSKIKYQIVIDRLV